MKEENLFQRLNFLNDCLGENAYLSFDFKFVIHVVFRDLGKWNLSDKTTVTELANSYT